ncbi:kinase binding protein CGI-121-domain-containing protein [Endogone sp. FLAS-F59071]|nr:kinase binding protein CGI-121-domain-containing protein [Endogone sp. FLAS-F59071]|eukprot:RUS17060.1 kinase binding protein CGI-121-domain-containing protein [Endogone sp. FLAS-F59071]
METFPLELYPTKGPIHIALYTGITNARELRERLLAADTSLSFAFVDAKVVIDKFQLLVAANKAVHDEHHGHLTTHNVHSEIVYNMSPTTNISESLRRFGISDTTTAIVIAKVGGEADEVRTRLVDLIKGNETPLQQVEDHTDLKTVRKYYKLNDGPQLEKQNLLDVVIGSMALKGNN